MKRRVTKLSFLFSLTYGGLNARSPHYELPDYFFIEDLNPFIGHDYWFAWHSTGEGAVERRMP